MLSRPPGERELDSAIQPGRVQIPCRNFEWNETRPNGPECLQPAALVDGVQPVRGCAPCWHAAERDRRHHRVEVDMDLVVLGENEAKAKPASMVKAKRPSLRRGRGRRRRVQLDLLGDVFERVVKIQELNGLESVRVVFRQAFRLYEWYTVRRLEGWSIQLVHRDGRIAHVDLGLDGEVSPFVPSVRQDAIHQPGPAVPA